jgi:sulfate permease, SulP family
MTLSVGPVALASLLTGTLVNDYNVTHGTQDAVNVGTEAALSVGALLMILSVLNLGFLIQYVSRPVMSGFTTGAAMIIGLQQLKVSLVIHSI